MYSLKIQLFRCYYSSIRWIKSNGLLYKAWIVMRGRRRYLDYFPSSKTDLMIEGYPSSANSFITNLLLKLSNKNVRFAHHIHTIAALRLSLKSKMIRIIIFRHPLDAVISRYSRIDGINVIKESKIEHYLKEYINFYEFILKHTDKFLLCSFKSLKANIVDFVHVLPESRIIDKSKSAVELMNIEREIVKEMNEWFEEGNGFKEHDGIPLPSYERERRRESIKHYFTQSTEYIASLEVFRKIEAEYQRQIQSQQG